MLDLKVQHALRLVSEGAAEAAAHNGLPCPAVLEIKLLLEGSRDILLGRELWERRGGGGESSHTRTKENEGAGGHDKIGTVLGCGLTPFT